MPKKVGSGNAQTPFSKFCIIRDDPFLREFIKIRMQQRNLTAYALAKKAGIEQGNLRNFLNKGTKSVSQIKVMELCEILGMRLSLKIENDEEH